MPAAVPFIIHSELEHSLTMMSSLLKVSLWKSANGCKVLLKNLPATTVKAVSCRMLATNMSEEYMQNRKTFQDMLPKIIDTAVTSPELAKIPEEAKYWIKNLLDYNLAGGKKVRGLATVFAYETFEKPENITDESMRSARIMGWCVELLQAVMVVTDDVMDGSTTRHDKPCWFRRPDVGMGAVNDAVFIYSLLHHVLQTHFSTLPQFNDIIKIFDKSLLICAVGQYLDFSTPRTTKKEYSLFTADRYESIIKYKADGYQLSFTTGMMLANIKDETIIQRSDEICYEIGKLYQIQDDFIDCFVDESITGKQGTDIQEGKCTWLAVSALQHCNPAQRALFTECYANSNLEKVQQIKQLYEQLHLPELFEEYERASYEKIVNMSEEFGKDTSLSPKAFLKLNDLIYKRKC